MSGSESAVSVDSTWWRRSRLLEPRSIVGAIVLVAVVAALALAIPYLEDNVEQSGVLDEAGRFIVDDYTTMVLPDGWNVDSQSEFFTVVTDGTYQLIVVVSNPDATAPEDALSTIHDQYSADPANTVTDIETFATDDGGAAAEYRAFIATDPTGNGNAFGAVSQNGRLFQPSMTGPPDLDDPYFEMFTEMLRSVVITAEPREGSS